MATPERLRQPEDRESEVYSHSLVGLELDPEQDQDRHGDPWADLAVAAIVAIPVLFLFVPSLLH